MSAQAKFYRNRAEVKQIEPGALWERQSETMILVDEDQHVTVEYSVEEFEEADLNVVFED